MQWARPDCRAAGLAIAPTSFCAAGRLHDAESCKCTIAPRPRRQHRIAVRLLYGRGASTQSLQVASWQRQSRIGVAIDRLQSGRDAHARPATVGCRAARRPRGLLALANIERSFDRYASLTVRAGPEKRSSGASQAWMLLSYRPCLLITCPPVY